MKRVSFEIAKAIKEAGYPQGQEEYAYRSNGETYIFEDMFDHIPDYCCDAPTYMEVWLWLWREKKINIKDSRDGAIWIWIGDNPSIYLQVSIDPEEAIITAIKYLVENNLVK